MKYLDSNICSLLLLTRTQQVSRRGNISASIGRGGGGGGIISNFHICDYKLLSAITVITSFITASRIIQEYNDLSHNDLRLIRLRNRIFLLVRYSVFILLFGADRCRFN